MTHIPSSEPLERTPKSPIATMFEAQSLPFNWDMGDEISDPEEGWYKTFDTPSLHRAYECPSLTLMT